MSTRSNNYVRMLTPPPTKQEPRVRYAFDKFTRGLTAHICQQKRLEAVSATFTFITPVINLWSSGPLKGHENKNGKLVAG